MLVSAILDNITVQRQQLQTGQAVDQRVKSAIGVNKKIETDSTAI